MQESLDTLKEKLTTALVLAHPDCRKTFVVSTGTSSKTIGAVMSQIGEAGREHPVHYASRILNAAESTIPHSKEKHS